MNNTVGIIGGAGFIGHNLVDYFLKNNYEVVVVGRKVDRIKICNDKLKLIECLIEKTDYILEELSNCGTIIWLISATIPSSSQKSLLTEFELNIKPLLQFLEKLTLMLTAKKFIFLSSGGAVYGNSTENKPISEIAISNPISSYGLSKLICEDYIKYLTVDSNLQSYILRPSNVYGIYQNLIKPQGIIGYAFKAILHKEPLVLYDKGRVTRDFIFVNDLAIAIDLCIKDSFQSSNCNIYNVGSQQPYTIKEILNKIENIAGAEIDFIPKISRKFDCNYNVLNIQKIANELNWSPNVTIDNGLVEVWNWMKNNKNDK
ncbi:NAD-dependent epimerase/dehydratase family protein [Arachidicoccus sp.]|uniref:NAD-dependent epimerase/dehydratase family protein n=1 Tax=Arachidicoccus sp. TaxID=1872624 RepID=UPI003D1C8385